jgi:DNA-cytosine methyltransferase
MTPEKLDRRVIDAKAKALRQTIAVQEARAYLANYKKYTAQNVVSRSMFREHVHELPSDWPELLASFGLHVTNKAVEELCLKSDDPTELAFVASRVVEYGGYTLIDPRQPEKPIRHLSASKSLGYFFTPLEVALEMARKLLVGACNGTAVLDPSAGSGALLSATLIIGKELGIQIGTVTGIEVDWFTSTLLDRILNRVQALIGSSCEIKIIHGDALDLLGSEIRHNSNLRESYDRIIMNPPYGRLRFLRSSLTNHETRVNSRHLSIDELDRRWKERTSEISKRLQAISQRLGVGSGIQDFSRVFMAVGLSRLSANGRLVIISPDSWMGDKSYHEMRRTLVQGKYIEEIITLRESANLFDTVNQSTAITVIQRGGRREQIRLTHEKNGAIVEQPVENITYEKLESLDPHWLRIPRNGAQNNDIVCQILHSPTIGQLHDLKNLRGEVDQSLFRNLITSDHTTLPLIRGDYIERYVVQPNNDPSRLGYIKADEFFQAFQGSPKLKDLRGYRLAGRQCSYAQKQRRLSFALVAPNTAIGNSCNYLCFKTDVLNERPSEKMWALLGLLNSAVLEWFFRMYNSNNHVANYEIDNLPVCLQEENISKLAASARFLQTTYQHQHESKIASAIEDFHDALVAFSYGLNESMILRVMLAIDPSRAKRVTNMLKCFYAGVFPPDMDTDVGWFNHQKANLSALDSEIISHVPQGGNWQDIPEYVPSERLKQIREMTKERGVVRTTYYGRLRPDQPAYTISTYFNRPGNGTNIHPYEQRTLSSREAARLQSFPDTYIFMGNQGAIRKQIGNAVPPLLAYALGNSIALKTGVGKCADIFCGAGGLSLGLELAGWSVQVAVDNEKYCALTYQFNRPCRSNNQETGNGTIYLHGDVNDRNLYQSIVNNCLSRAYGGLDLLVGGPPCQGFSHAGWRSEEDGRNDLASRFLRIVADVRPKVVVLENVEGILTFKHGQVVEDLLRTLQEIGYVVSPKPWVLSAEQYGVPQMRRRVFIVAATSIELLPDKPSPLFQKCAGRRERPNQLELGSSLPYPITVAEALYDLKPLCDEKLVHSKQQPTRTSYSEWTKGLLGVKDMLTGMSITRRG